jgi:hypothetical protein
MSGDPISGARVDVVDLVSLPRALSDFMLSIPSEIQVSLPLIEEGGRIESAARDSATADPGPSRRGFSTTTDASGRFVFGNVPVGKYSLQARAQGFFSAPSSGVPGIGSVFISWFEMRENQTVNLRLSLVKGGVVSGRLTRADGSPVPAVTLAAFREDYQPDGRLLFTSSTSRATDDRGEFRFFDLSPGQYRIAPSDPTFTRLRMINDWDSAYAVEVTPGIEVSGVNITLPSRPTFRVSGRILSTIPEVGTSTGRKIGAFYLVPLSSKAFTDLYAPTSRNIATDASVFEIEGVAPGSYEIISIATKDVPYVGRALIDVGMQDVRDVSITIQPNVEVRARIVYAQGVPGAAENSRRLELKPRERYAAPFDAVRSVSPPGAPVVEDTGAFVFRNISQGNYTFEIPDLEPNAFIADIRENGASVFDKGLVVGTASTSVEVVVDLAGETVAGTLLDASQKAVALERVVLIPEAPRRDNASLYKTVLTDSSGRFVLRGVAPGNYKLFGWSPSPLANAHRNNEFLGRYEDRGLPVRVEKGFSDRVNVTAISR